MRDKISKIGGEKERQKGIYRYQEKMRETETRREKERKKEREKEREGRERG